ncbi:MAG: DUF547 domain-containing protein [Deinococcales bacterium]
MIQNTLDLLRLVLAALYYPKVQILNPMPSIPTSSEAALEFARTNHFTPLSQASFSVPLEPQAAKAFWLNLYNALTLHAMHAANIQNSVLESLGFFNAYAYRIDGLVLTLNQIEHGILRANRPALVGLPPFAKNDPRAKWVLPLDARIHFALNCGAASCPPIRNYQAAQLEQQLELATHAYLSDCQVKDSVVYLPRLLSYYATDFGKPLLFTQRYRPDLPNNAKVRFLPYQWAKAYR